MENSVITSTKESFIFFMGWPVKGRQVIQLYPAWCGIDQQAKRNS